MTAARATAAAAAPCPTVPGTPFAGGYYAGRLRIDGQLHAIVVAPKAGGTLTGAWHPHRADVPGARSVCDGLANTRAMAAAGSALAQIALAVRIGGYDDWHIPARDALELMYRNLKPTTDENSCSYRDGENGSSEPPGLLYEKASPAQTDAEAFRAGGVEALEPAWHWSSTQISAHYAFLQGFRDGYVDWDVKDYEGAARLVREIPLQPFDLQPLRRAAPSDFFGERACACACTSPRASMPQALAGLLAVCQGMDLHEQGRRPTEAVYRQAMADAANALAAHLSAAGVAS